MIDFKNSKFVKMKKDKAPKLKDVSALLIPGEQVLGSYTAMRDRCNRPSYIHICSEIRTNKTRPGAENAGAAK